MSTSTWLISIGAALELFGIVFVAVDVWESARQRAQLSHPDRVVQLEAAAEAGATANPGVVTGGGPVAQPSLEERVGRLEDEVERTGRMLDTFRKQEKEAHREMLDRVSKWVAEARHEVFELREELRPLIGEAVAGNLVRRGVGVAAFLAGLVLQTVGNIV